jgi:hypothetical protein
MQHYDVYYVISSLRADKAFIFVAMPIQVLQFLNVKYPGFSCSVCTVIEFVRKLPNL